MSQAACEDEQAESNEDPEVLMKYRDATQLAGQPEEATEQQGIGNGNQAVRQGVCPNQRGLRQITIAVRQVIRGEQRRQSTRSRKGQKPQDTSDAEADPFFQPVPPLWRDA